MEYINIDGKKASEIKEIISKIDFKKCENEIIYSLINTLQSAERKNVKSLGDKLKRDYDKFLNEIERVKGLYVFDKQFGEKIVAGVDEVGRGPLAGPIVSAAVILDLNDEDINNLILYINDSKAVNEKKREELAEIIKEKALSYSISSCTNEEIDEKGIAFCNNKIFKDAVSGLDIKPNLVLSDGYSIKDFSLKNEFVIKGDAKSASIACASIIAKVYRDNLMKEYAEKYPYYDFEHNAGYGTKKHIEGIKQYGSCEIHRKSFLKNIEGL